MIIIDATAAAAPSRLQRSVQADLLGDSERDEASRAFGPSRTGRKPGTGQVERRLAVYESVGYQASGAILSQAAPI